MVHRIGANVNKALLVYYVVSLVSCMGTNTPPACVLNIVVGSEVLIFCVLLFASYTAWVLDHKTKTAPCI